MDGESEVDFSSNSLTPLWRRRSTPQPQLLGRSKPRPQSYQSPSGLLITDFPVEDRGTLPAAQTPAQLSAASDGRKMQRSPQLPRGHRRLATNGKTVSPEFRAVSPRLRRPKSPQVPKAASGGPPKSPANGTATSPARHPLHPPRTPHGPAPSSPEGDRAGFPASPLPSPAANGFIPTIASPGARSPSGQMAKDPERGPSRLSPAPQKRSLGQKLPLQRLPSQENELLENASVVLSTNSPAALKVGKQQIIPKSLASEIKISKSNSQNVEPHKRLLKVRSMVEGLGAPLGPAEDEGEAENDLDSPGSLRRGLRSTSYRRAVVSGVDFDSPTTSKKKNRMSQPVLKAVMEDKEKFSSLGRIKKKMLKGQGTFDGEENAVLYQNYKEKALDIDSDEESEPKEQKSDEKIVIHHKPLRSTWSQLSAVKRNGLSQTVSQEERKRQEAIFEVISSEHSYLLSLEILIRMFKNSKALSDTMTKTENHHLFSNITDVCEASKKFFTELEARHQNNIFIDDISDIVEKHTASTFDPYVKYCTNEVYQQRTLQKLLATNPSFKEALSRIESHEDCRNLPMISFLILPMQRVTRLPLLMDTICQKTPKDSPKYEVCKRAFKEVSKLVRLCNEGARKMERTEMMYTINSQLEFKIKPFPLVSSSRWLVKRGELTAYVEDTVLFSKRTSKQQVYFFLFNDVLIITKKKSEESYNVNDYSLRDQLLVESCDGEELSPSPGRNSATTLYSRQNSASHLFTLIVLSNHANEKVEMLLGAETQSERARWITALGHSSGKQPPDRTSLTQVEIIRSFTAKQPDELSLQVADVVLIYQRVSDGWYEGERLRDGERGWFPMECAKEITCQATIDKNVERMGRLLGLETNV
ncbi:rho guanine nucleotide exchange factor 26 isoform X1 [Hippopotamus amphibius kiboko]|uniref:rho guanine nucleotide exchange factor 26 isoform X1 n=1 Tax=Hippopotamus amphibius kiboko TaxID=575201 RepID=UPI00259980CD|nr:rho guanine nucleotide exchange factor 26 isoform X1 [Hippopotamus amphibius kiboko]XP_057595879.1 rho guanine nucleotide exchange factor 26 isoform X1 [Hippopotamus amphibius kiboko]